jgi:hypothetical protein
MAYENIRLGKPNLAVYGGYFYTLDDVLDIFIVKTDDGTQAFTYPLNSSVGDNSIKSIEFDGYNLWTLETMDFGVSSSDPSYYSIRIRRWYIHNYVLQLANSFEFIGNEHHKFSSEAMSVESYTVRFSDSAASGRQTLSIGDDSSGDICSKISGGNRVILGPNQFGRTEEFTVSSAGSDYVVINGTTNYSYAAGDPIRFYKNIWLFNNFDGADDSIGALYRISPFTGSIISKTPDNAYKNIKAATFTPVPYFVFNGGSSTVHPQDYAIGYIKATNMIFLNPDDLNVAYGSLVMDNVQDDMTSVIEIYDVSVSERNIYRLQRKATYYGDTSEFSNDTYNYQLSTLNSFITSISLSADPAILPANGESVSTIKAIVKDQFNQPVTGKAVAFTADDPDGQIVSVYVNTDSDGVATTVYRAGIEAREVRITSTAQQG